MNSVFIQQCTYIAADCVFLARTDRYSHEFLSDDDEEEGEDYSISFHNFASTSARYSMILETHDEVSDSSETPPHGDKAEASSSGR